MCQLDWTNVASCLVKYQSRCCYKDTDFVDMIKICNNKHYRYDLKLTLKRLTSRMYDLKLILKRLSSRMWVDFIQSAEDRPSEQKGWDFLEKNSSLTLEH